MSSSDGRKITGAAAIVVLVLFGVAGFLLDRMRNADEELKIVEPIPVEVNTTTAKKAVKIAIKQGGKSKSVGQKSGAKIADLANDSTRTVVDKTTLGQSADVSTGKGREPVAKMPKVEKPPSLQQTVEHKSQTEGTTSKSPKQVEPKMLNSADEKTSEKWAAKTAAKPEMETGEPVRSLVPAKPTMLVAEKSPSPSVSSTTSKKVSMPDAKILSFGKMKYSHIDANSGEIAIAGMAQAGNSLRLLLDGNNIGEVVADKTGAWSFKIKQKLAQGIHWLVGEQLDDKGKLIVRIKAPFDVAIALVGNKAVMATKAPSKAFAADQSKDALAMIRAAVADDKKGKQRIPSAAVKLEKSAKSVDIVMADMPEKGIGNENNKKDMWDSFAGIFKVDPGKKEADASPAAKDQLNKLADVSKQLGKERKLIVKKQVVHSFAFESLNYSENVAEGAVELKGHGVPGSRIRLFKGARKIGEVVADNKGFWSFVNRGKVKPGIHLFKAGHVLKNGRIVAEARMQYDHIVPTGRVAGSQKLEPDVKSPLKSPLKSSLKPIVKPIVKPPVMADAGAIAGKEQKQKQSVARASASMMVGADKGRVDKRPVAGAADVASATDQPPMTRSLIIKKPETAAAVPKFRSAKRKIRRGSKRRARARTARSKMRKAKSRRTRHAKRKRLVLSKRGERRSGVSRYNLGRNKSKAKYRAKRKLYPRSKKIPARVRIVKGTTLWGYSRHYYGRGKLYPHIRRANRRTISNPDKIFAGQRIRIPRHVRKRRKNR